MAVKEDKRSNTVGFCRLLLHHIEYYFFEYYFFHATHYNTLTEV